MTMDYETQERLILALLRAKRKVKDDELTKELNDLQRTLEEEYGEYGVVLAPEHNCQPGWKPE